MLVCNLAKSRNVSQGLVDPVDDSVTNMAAVSWWGFSISGWEFTKNGSYHIDGEHFYVRADEDFKRHIETRLKRVFPKLNDTKNGRELSKFLVNLMHAYVMDPRFTHERYDAYAVKYDRIDHYMPKQHPSQPDNDTVYQITFMFKKYGSETPLEVRKNDLLALIQTEKEPLSKLPEDVVNTIGSFLTGYEGPLSSSAQNRSAFAPTRPIRPGQLEKIFSTSWIRDNSWRDDTDYRGGPRWPRDYADDE